jgi:flagellar hook-associated protein 2
MANISFSGIASGLDTQAIVNALVAAEIEPQRAALSTRQKSFDAQLSAIGRVKSALGEFETALKDLNTADKFQARSANLSSEDYFSATARPSAQPGSYQITVENMAKAQSLMTAQDASFRSETDTVGSGSITISLGGAFDSELNNGFTVDIDPAAATLADIRDAINSAADNQQVTASIVNVDDGVGGTQSRLLLTSRETGTANAINVAVTEGSVAGLSALATENLEVARQAEDAVVTVNGLTATRSSNQIGDVISGVSLDLTKAAPGEEVNLTIGTDNEEVGKNVQAFVDAYNKLQNVMKDLTTKEGSALRTDSTLRMLTSRIRTEVAAVVDTGDTEANLLAQIGVNVDKDGVMSLNSTKLNEQLDRSFSSVADLFSSDQGVASRLTDLVKPYVQSGGLLDDRTDSLNSRVKSAEDQEARLDLRQESLYNRLSKQFNAMDSLVAQINSNGSFLAAQLASLNQAI